MREPSLVERFDYYEKLLRGRIPLDRVHVKKGSLVGRIPTGWRVVALDERGDQPTSVMLSLHVSRWQHTGVTGIAFLIGDADGFLPDEQKAAHERLSLSRLTLPHQLCFVILAEQLYRATSILRGEKYHRE